MPTISIIIPSRHPESRLRELRNPEAQETIIITPKNAKKLGRAPQMNQGAQDATGDTLLFLHDDTTLPPNALSQIQTLLTQNPQIAAGAFSLKFDTNSLYLKLLAKLTTLRSKLTRTPYGDQAIFIRKSIFQKLNGYPDVPILEDILLMEALKKACLPIHIFPDSVITSPDKYLKNGLLKNTLKNRITVLKHMLN